VQKKVQKIKSFALSLSLSIGSEQALSGLGPEGKNQQWLPFWLRDVLVYVTARYTSRMPVLCCLFSTRLQGMAAGLICRAKCLLAVDHVTLPAAAAN
jgi:hypothetical protein